MSSVVGELDKQLQSMLEMKAPGANQAKISSVTTLCNANIQVRITLMPPGRLATLSRLEQLLTDIIVRDRPHSEIVHTF